MKKILFLILVSFSSINSVTIELTGGKFLLIPYKTEAVPGQYYNELELYFYNRTDNRDFKNLHLYNLSRGKNVKFHTETERFSFIFKKDSKVGEESNFSYGFSLYRSKLQIDNYINQGFTDLQFLAFLLNQNSYYETFKSNPSQGKTLIEDLLRPKHFKYYDSVSPGFQLRYTNGYEQLKFYADLFIAIQGKNGVQLSYTDMLVFTLGTKIVLGEIGLLMEASLADNNMRSYSYINGVYYKSFLTQSFRLGASLNF